MIEPEYIQLNVNWIVGNKGLWVMRVNMYNVTEAK